jgi:pyridoxine kinase
MNILSIQSWVAYGHVGNASAVFPLQRLGANVWAVNTVQFSNHTGYGAWKGDVFTGEQVGRVIEGIAERGVFAGCDAVLSGYMGDRGIGEAILAAVEQVKQANPGALYCCDPVIGDDDTGSYVRPGIDVFLRDQALRAADIITPNRFEAEWLSGMTCRTLADAKAVVARLQAMMAPDGARIVLVTSLRTEDTPDDAIDMLAAEGDAVVRLRTPLHALNINGAGDAIAALFLFHRLRTGSVAAALAASGSAIHGVLKRTAAAGSREILTVAAQDEFVSPSELFVAEAV